MEFLMDTSDAAPNSLQASWLTPRLAICRAVSGSWRRSAPARGWVSTGHSAGAAGGRPEIGLDEWNLGKSMKIHGNNMVYRFHRDFLGVFYGKSNHDISWMGNLRKWINYDQFILNFKEWRTIFHILAGLTKITNQPSRWKWVVQAGNDGNFVELGIHMDKITSTAIWGFPKMGVPQNWGKIPNKNGWWLGVPLWLRKPPYRRGWVHLDIDRQRAEVVLRTLNSGY